MWYCKITYRFEVRITGQKPEFTNDETKAINIAFVGTNDNGNYAVIVDNDAKRPAFARVANNFIEILN